SRAAVQIGSDIARALDPARIAIDAGITPDEWQAELLRSDADRILMLCSRQAGKTTTAAFMSLFTAIYRRPGGLVIIVSPSQRQSGEIFRTVMRHRSNLKSVPEMRQESLLRAEMSNGSRILALPGSETTVRGYSAADLIVIDEASRVEDALLQAVRPMLATSQGRLVALTTPAGKRGWFYEAWIGDGNWHRVKVPASMCPRISKEFLAEELKELGASRFSEEYELEFIDPDTAAFPTDIISRCFTALVTPLWGKGDDMALTKEKGPARGPPPLVSWQSPSLSFVGVDLGQSQAPPALCILEAYEQVGDPADPSRFCYDVRHLMRFPLGM